MPTSDDLKQRLNSAATQEHSEFAMALLVSEVIDTHLDAQGTKQQLDALMTPLTKLSSSRGSGSVGLFLSCRFWWSSTGTC